jgi:HEAT repeat protein
MAPGRPMNQIATLELMATCDAYWSGPRDYALYVEALNELVKRGRETLAWARGLLVHPDYDAREFGAFLLGQLGRRGLLGKEGASVVEELGALTRRPVEEDCKELQAVDSAITALGAIGSPAGIPYLKDVLFSDDEWLAGDSQWNAAEELGRLVGETFMHSPDPVAAARSWLEANG